MAHRGIALTLLLCLVAGCRGVPVATSPAREGAASTVTTQAASPSPAGLASATPAPRASTPTGLPGATGAGLITDNGSGVISNDGSTLSGIVRLPTTLISDQGTGIITDNGSGIITDNGSGIITDNGSGILANNGSGVISNDGSTVQGHALHLLATPTSLPFAFATVSLLDGAGNPVTGQDGKPLTAVTDRTGHYAFKLPLPKENLVASVTLSGGKGQVQAVVAKDGGTQVNLDLVSTLTTTYILSQYVDSQKDRQVTFDRLPASVEADTRTKASNALAAGSVAVPDTLTTQKVVATVESLRTQDRTLDTQLELVKKLLILAGQSDLGNGRPALQVPLSNVVSLAVGPDGLLYIATYGDARVWRVNADGTIETVAGTGEAFDAAIDGKPPTKAGLDWLGGISFDAKGRLIIREAGVQVRRWSRLESDGTLHVLWQKNVADFKSADDPPRAVIPGPGDSVWALFASSGSYTMHALQPGGGDSVVATLPDATNQLLGTGGSLQGSADGGVFLWQQAFDKASGTVTDALWRVSTKDWTATQVTGVPADALGISFDATGDLFYKDATDGLHVRPVGGDDRLVLANYMPPGATHAGWYLNPGVPLALAPDGTVYAGFGPQYPCTQVGRISGGKLAPYAGSDGTVASKAGDLALQGPIQTLYDAAGMLYVLDNNRVLKIAPDQTVGYYAGDVQGSSSPTVRVPFGETSGMGLDGAGNLYVEAYDALDVFDAMTIWKIDPKGQVTQRCHIDEAPVPTPRLAVGKDGSLLFSTGNGLREKLMYLAPDATTATELTFFKTGTDMIGRPEDPNLGSHAFCANPQGGFSLLSPGQGSVFDPKSGTFSNIPGTVTNWTPDKGPQPGGSLPYDFTPFTSSGLIYGPDGRLFIAVPGNIYLLDPQKGVLTPVAGKGTANFGGDDANSVLKDAVVPCFNPAGDMVFADRGNKQVRRIPKGQY